MILAILIIIILQFIESSIMFYLLGDAAINIIDNQQTIVNNQSKLLERVIKSRSNNE